MYRKLLSNLPFNPSLINQVSFYARRLREEQGLRRTGLVLIALSMAVQLFAVMSPTEASVRASSNDILYGGFQSKNDAVTKCRQNSQEFATILAYYGISCDTLASTGTTDQYLNSRDHGGELDSLGRNPQGPTIARTGKLTDEYAVTIGRTYYMKNLWSWDSGSSSTYHVLRVTNASGRTIYILFDCGNIVTTGRYSPPNIPPPPKCSRQCNSSSGVRFAAPPYFHWGLCV